MGGGQMGKTRSTPQGREQLADHTAGGFRTPHQAQDGGCKFTSGGQLTGGAGMQQEEQAAPVGAPLHGQHRPSVDPGSHLQRWAVAAAAAAAAQCAACDGRLLRRQPLLLQQRVLVGWAGPNGVHSA